MGAELLVEPFGSPATARLAALIDELQGGDPFAPVTVATPSIVAGITLRRALAAATGGLVGVAFTTLPKLAEGFAAARLAAAGRPPLEPVLGRGHLRALLAAEPGALVPGPSTERALAATFAELSALEAVELRALEQRGGTTAATVGLFARWRYAIRDHVLPADVLREAVVALAAGEAGPVPPVVVHLLRRVDGPVVHLLARLAEVTELRVVLGAAGQPDADAATQAVADRLAARLGVVAPVVGGDAEWLPGTVVWAPDPTEEVEVAVREVAGALAAGTPAERIAVLAHGRDPYTAAVHERLSSLGVPHHAPRVTTLAQSAPGRVLTALLDVVAGDFRRTDVMALLRSAPLVDLVTLAPPPVPTWDRLAREAGVLRGLDQWRTRLGTANDERRRWIEASGEDPAGDRRFVATARLLAFVEALAARLEPGGTATWLAWSRWIGELLDELLAPEVLEVEADAMDSVRSVLASLGVLDGVDAPPDRERFRRVLEHELDRPAGRHGRLGHGVVVGTLADAAGADLDLVVVLGAAEGQLPPRRRDDSLVPDRERAAAGGALLPRGRSRGEEQRDLTAALAGGRVRILTGPRSDPREQRERQPAPWLLEACTRHEGRLVGGADLPSLRSRSWFRDLASFETWPAERSPATPLDLDLGDLLRDHRAARPVATGVVAVENPALARGLRAADSRRTGTFDEWSGHVGTRPDLLIDLDRPRSPTGLEQYAACPFRFFLSNMLRIGAVRDPSELDVMSALDEGSLVHEVLEQFILEAGPKPPDEPWSDTERQRMLELVDAVAGRYRAAGRTGRDLLWSVRAKQLRHQLLRVLDTDEQLRAADGVSPRAVELSFGWGDEGPVTLELHDGRTVAFKGTADRVDVSPDGRRLVVYDYKTGKHEPFNGVRYGGDGGGDLTARGTKLQLPIYALAARTRWPDVEEIEARYWFVGARSNGRTLGGPFDAAAEERFRDVVGTVVDGVEAGRFPANPGKEDYRFGEWTHDNCGWCDFDRLCPTTRGEAWVQIRKAPELAGYVALAEEHELADDHAEGPA